MAFFRRRSKKQTMEVRLNARLRPLDRGELFEDPLEAHLFERSLRAAVAGGGTPSVPVASRRPAMSSWRWTATRTP